MSHGGTRIAVFYHVARLGTWEAVDTEIMACLHASGLLAAADLFVRNECADTDLFEFPTLEMVRGLAASGDYAILYLHTKGVSQPKPQIDDWRECLLYWTVTRWEECVDKLVNGFDAVGICRIPTPMPHYQGNFWWAHANHIRKLGPVSGISFMPEEANQVERHKAEFWLMSVPGMFYQPYHHRIDPYLTRNLRSNYEGRAF